jgi:hypothetical protein
LVAHGLIPNAFFLVAITRKIHSGSKIGESNLTPLGQENIAGFNVCVYYFSIVKEREGHPYFSRIVRDAPLPLGVHADEHSRV